MERSSLLTYIALQQGQCAACFDEEAPELQKLRRKAMFVATILRALMRVVNAVGEANKRRAEREIAEVMRRRGDKFTDSYERWLERSFFSRR